MLVSETLYVVTVDLFCCDTISVYDGFRKAFVLLVFRIGVSIKAQLVMLEPLNGTTKWLCWTTETNRSIV